MFMPTNSNNCQACILSNDISDLETLSLVQIFLFSSISFKTACACYYHVHMIDNRKLFTAMTGTRPTRIQNSAKNRFMLIEFVDTIMCLHFRHPPVDAHLCVLTYGVARVKVFTINRDGSDNIYFSDSKTKCAIREIITLHCAVCVSKLKQVLADAFKGAFKRRGAQKRAFFVRGTRW